MSYSSIQQDFMLKSHYWVFVDTVSRASKTAPIARFICRPPPPATGGYVPTSCGIVLATLGIASLSRHFCGLPLPPQYNPRHLYKPDTSPSNNDALCLSLSPLLSLRPQCTAPFWGCRVIRWLPFFGMMLSHFPLPSFRHFQLRSHWQVIWWNWGIFSSQFIGIWVNHGASDTVLLLGCWDLAVGVDFASTCASWSVILTFDFPGLFPHLWSFLFFFHCFRVVLPLFLHYSLLIPYIDPHDRGMHRFLGFWTGKRATAHPHTWDGQCP